MDRFLLFYAIDDVTYSFMRRAVVRWQVCWTDAL